MLMLWTTDGAAGLVWTRSVCGSSDSASELSSEPDEEAEEELMAAARGKERVRQRKLWIVERLIPCKRKKEQ
jgi:hypothetical protein